MNYKKTKFYSLLLVALLFIGCRFEVRHDRSSVLMGDLFNEENMTEKVKARSIILSLEPEEFQNFHRVLVRSKSINKPSVQISQSNNLEISIKVISDSENSLDTVLEGISWADLAHGSDLIVDIPKVKSYLYKRVNAKEYIQGTCIESISISIPMTSDIQVIVGDRSEETLAFMIENKELKSSFYSGNSVEELVSILDDISFSESQLKALESYIHARGGRFLYVSDVALILDEVNFDKVNAARIISGHVIDTKNVYKLADAFRFPSEVSKGLEYLAQ